MACIGKITTGIGIPCGAPTPADMGRPVSAKLLNASDIASFTVTSGVAAITRVPKAVGYNVSAINNALTGGS